LEYSRADRTSYFASFFQLQAMQVEGVPEMRAAPLCSSDSGILVLEKERDRWLASSSRSSWLPEYAWQVEPRLLGNRQFRVYVGVSWGGTTSKPSLHDQPTLLMHVSPFAF